MTHKLHFTLDDLRLRRESTLSLSGQRQLSDGQAVEVTFSFDLEELMERLQCIAAIWTIEDVLDKRSDLTTEQALHVLRITKLHHDAGIGINWDTLEFYAEHLYPETLNEGAHT